MKNIPRILLLATINGVISLLVLASIERITIHYAKLQDQIEMQRGPVGYILQKQPFWNLTTGPFHIALFLVAGLMVYFFFPKLLNSPFLLWLLVAIIVILGWALTFLVGIVAFSGRAGHSPLERTLEVALYGPNQRNVLVFVAAVLGVNVIFGMVLQITAKHLSRTVMPVALAAFAIALVVAANAGFAGGATPAAPRTTHFRFQNNFWVNLHHFVRAEARRRTIGADPVLALSSLSDSERVDWTAALDAYAELVNKSLVFDASLVATNNALAVRKGEGKLPAGLVDPAITAALNRAAPVFRAHVWPEVRRANEAWIAQFRTLAEQHATKLFPALAGAYHVTWPKSPVLVDTSIETGPTLAYTTGGPPGTAGHTTIAPTKTQDLSVAIETLFHEASHVVDDQITRAVEAEGVRQHVKPLPDLWHGIIFFTAGELVRRELGKAGDATYQPYAVRFGVWERGWQTIHAALEKEWLPYLNGKVSYEKALAGLVAAGSTAQPENSGPAVSEDATPLRGGGSRCLASRKEPVTLRVLIEG
jgi:hypothetical protein